MFSAFTFYKIIWSVGYFQMYGNSLYIVKYIFLTVKLSGEHDFCPKEATKFLSHLPVS